MSRGAASIGDCRGDARQKHALKTSRHGGVAFERAYIEAALKQTGGNVSRAAELAQVNRKFIQRAMKNFGLRGDDTSDG